MFRTTSTVISMLLLYLLFIPTHSLPSNENKDTPLNRAKRTFGFFGTRDWSPFYQSWRVPTYTTMPNVFHVMNDHDLYVNIMKKILDLEFNQKHILSYLHQLYELKNSNPCEPRRPETSGTSSNNGAQLPVEQEVLYRDPGSTTTSSIDSSNSSSSSSSSSSSENDTDSDSSSNSSSSEEAVTKFPIEKETVTPTSEEASVESSRDDESHNSYEPLEPGVATPIPVRAYSHEDFVHIRDLAEKNDVL